MGVAVLARPPSMLALCRTKGCHWDASNEASESVDHAGQSLELHGEVRLE